MIGYLGWVGMFLGALVARWRSSSLLREREDDNAEVEALYEKFQGLLRRRCVRILRDGHSVDDVMQEIFATLCRCHRQFEGNERQRLAWLYRIAMTHCLQYIARNNRWHRDLGEQLLPLGPLGESQQANFPVEDHIAIGSLLQALGEEEREAVLYRYISGMTQEEIAEVMGVSRDRVRRWLERFKARGRMMFEEFEAFEDYK